MVIEKIQKPNDIKKLSHDELPILADEIREFIIDKVSGNGGHLASNLGVVELTIALHLCMDFPEDKLIWDVGHQSYTHKILTGRKDGFDRLRKINGLSGFPKREESSCDSFDTGHSSTSLSAGLGMVCARDLNQDSYQVVSVIGDGSFTGGLAFEALNNAAALESNYTMILNDNHMSISENVGGLAKYLAGIRTTKGYNNLKENVTASLNRIPGIGEGLVKNISGIKSMLKQAVIPGMLFENIGITYLGPIDGHDIDALVKVIRDAQKLQKAVLIHVITQKGRGYDLAERHPEAFHGVGPFNRENGKSEVSKKEPCYTDVFSKTICRLAEKDKHIVGITAAMKEGTGLSRFARKFPERFFDVGIAEEHAVTFACGMALGGYHPFVVIYSSFLQRGFDQIIHDLCMQNLPVTLLLDRSGLVGNDGETHQGVFDLSYLALIPNIAVFAPKNKTEFSDALEFAASYPKPFAIRYPKTCAIDRFNDHRDPIRLGKAEYMRKGSRIALLAIGTMVETAMDTAEKMIAAGYDPTVVNLRFAKPLDEDMLREVLEHHELAVTIEENCLSGGVGEHICAFAEKESYRCNVVSFGIPDCFIRQGSINELKKLTGLDADSIYRSIIEKTEGKAD